MSGNEGSLMAKVPQRRPDQRGRNHGKILDEVVEADDPAALAQLPGAFDDQDAPGRFTEL